MSDELKNLWRLVDEMGATRVKDFDISLPTPKSIVIQEGLSKGVDIDLDDLDDKLSVGGLLSYKGRQVLVYIPDQGASIETVIRNPESGKKFHVSHCGTLRSMQRKNRNHRYVATNDTSGIFDLTNWTGTERGRGALTVCRNCLSHLNYKDYTGRNSNRMHIYRQFNLKEFFSTYSSLFRYKYSDSVQSGARQYKVRESAGKWEITNEPIACSNCGVTGSGNMKFSPSDVNRNSVRDDVLCSDCHRRVNWEIADPVLPSDMKKITRKRREQGLLDNVLSWKEAIGLADPSFHGLMKLYERQGYRVPDVGHPLTDSAGTVLDIEIPLAWEHSKRGVVATLEERDQCRDLGWKVQTLDEALFSAREDGSF